MRILFADKFEITHDWFNQFKIEVIAVRFEKEQIVVTIPHNRRNLLSIIETFKNSVSGDFIKLTVGEDVMLIDPKIHHYTFALKKQDSTHMPLQIDLYFSNKIIFENL